MNFSSILAGGAFVGLLASFWGKIRALIWRGANLFIQQIEVQEGLGIPLLNHLIDHPDFKLSPFYDKVYSATQHNTIDGRRITVAFERFGDKSIIFWYRKRYPIMLSQNIANNNNNNQNNGNNAVNAFNAESSGGKYFITFLRGTVNIDELFSKCCETRDVLLTSVNKESATKTRRHFIMHFPGDSGESNGTRKANETNLKLESYLRVINIERNKLGQKYDENKRSLDALIFPKEVKSLIREILSWKESKQWYSDRDIPWKRGWCLYGPPGTGKTALARAFAEDLDMPIFVFNLAQLTNVTFVEKWKYARQYAPCIMLIEDIDNVFHGRKNITSDRLMFNSIFDVKEKGKEKNNNHPSREEAYSTFGLNFDVFLNCLDGVERNDGIFTIITTNKIEHIDEALGKPRKLPDGRIEFISTRPGRIDKSIELTYMTKEGKIEMARRILSEYPEEHKKILEFVEKYLDLQETPAQFQERCAQIALARYWNETHKSEEELYYKERPRDHTLDLSKGILAVVINEPTKEGNVIVEEGNSNRRVVATRGLPTEIGNTVLIDFGKKFILETVGLEKSLPNDDDDKDDDDNFWADGPEAVDPQPPASEDGFPTTYQGVN